MIKIKTNEQEIKELETRLKNVNEQLDEFTALREQFNMMHEAGDMCFELNIQVADIESEIAQLKSLGVPKKEVGSMIEDIEIKSSCIAPGLEDTIGDEEFFPNKEGYCTGLQVELERQKRNMVQVGDLIEQMPIAQELKVVMFNLVYPASVPTDDVFPF